MKWAAQMTEAQIRAVRAHDKHAKTAYFGATSEGANKTAIEKRTPNDTAFGRIKGWLFGKR